MKHQTTRRTAGLIFAIFATSVSFGQLAKTKTIKPETLLSTPFSAAATTEKDLTKLEELKATNEKLYNNFSRKFKGASNITVHPSKKTTGILCMVDGIRNNILFTHKGSWMHTIKYYTPDQLPKHIKALVEQDLPQFKMLQVAEVITPLGTAHLIDMETLTMHRTIRVVNGDWDVYNEFLKQAK